MPEEKAGGILGFAQSIFGAGADWTRYVFWPLSLVQEGLAENLQQRTGAVIGRFWVFPVFLMIVSDGMVLHFYGIELERDYKLASLYLTFTILKLVFEAFILYLILRLTGVETTEGVVFLTYSIAVVYAPFFGWLNTWGMMGIFGAVKLLMAQKLGIGEALRYFFSHAREINEAMPKPLPQLGSVLPVLGQMLNLLSLTLVAESIAQILRLDRPKAYVATAIAGALDLIPAVLFALIRAGLLFEGISAAQTKAP